VPSLVHVLATVLLSVGVALGQVSKVPHNLEAARREPFAWQATYAEALQAARERSRPVVLYFPPVRDADEPSVVARLPKLFGVPPVVEGVRVGADEILQLLCLSTYEKTSSPAGKTVWRCRTFLVC
jgi:hypothetical protein